MWMAGGGVRGGMNYGATDEFGIAAVEDKFHIHDLHATTLHLLGLDHTRLTFRYAGRDFRPDTVASPGLSAVRATFLSGLIPLPPAPSGLLLTDDAAPLEQLARSR